MSIHEIMDVIDENKDKLPDGVYKTLCDKMSELNTKRRSLAVCHAILVTTYHTCCEGGQIHDENVKLLLNIKEDDEGDGYKFNSGTVSRKCFENTVEEIQKRGHSRHIYDYSNDSYLLILSFELI